MKFILIFFTLLLSINTFSVHTARNVIEGFIKIITNDSEFEFGKECITEKFDLILNDMYYSAHEYYYTYKQEDKLKYLLQFIMNLIDLFNETSNCNKPNLSYNIFFFISGIIDKIKTLNDEYLKTNWKEFVKIENELFNVYNSKEFSGVNFGIALGEFLNKINDLLPKI